MKILTEREKKILINHAKKQELRRIISKKKKKNKRRYLQGKSKTVFATDYYSIFCK